MGVKKTYFVPEERLRDMMEAEFILTALESGGVDHWSGYNESINQYKFEWMERLGKDTEKLKDFSLRDVAKLFIDKDFQAITEMETV